MTTNSFLIRYASGLRGNAIFWIIMICIATDMLFGALRAWKNHKWNSSVGLDGFIRKIGIVSCVMILRAIDTVLQADLFGFLPVEAQNALTTIGLTNAGFMEFFGIIDIMYECTSILKNMVIVGIPIPKGLRGKIAHWLENMTDETNVELIDPGTPNPAIQK